MYICTLFYNWMKRFILTSALDRSIYSKGCCMYIYISFFSLAVMVVATWDDKNHTLLPS